MSTTTADLTLPNGLKERHFRFGAGIPATVECMHCGWTSRGTARTAAQQVFDRSCDHECTGVESYAAMRERDERERAAEQAAPVQPVAEKPTVYLSTLQFSWGGLFDAKPADGYAVHLIRGTAAHGTPGPTLCGIDRFAKDAPGWSVGGGLSGPGVVHTPCPGCAETARREFSGLPVSGTGAKAMGDELGVAAYGHSNDVPVVREYWAARRAARAARVSR